MNISKNYIMQGYNTVCFNKSFTIVLQMLLCGECYENVDT
jgi:hypothetical protein